MLDLHMYANEVHLCHNEGRECGPVPGLHYGTPRQTFAGSLRTIVDFLNENRGEVVTLLLEDYADASALGSALNSVPGLNDLIFRPDTWKVREQGWPKLSDMVAQNKRLLMLSSASGRESMGVFYGKDYTVENYWSLGRKPNFVSVDFYEQPTSGTRPASVVADLNR